MTKTSDIEVGTVICGTHRPEDLVPTLLGECRAHGLVNHATTEAANWCLGRTTWRESGWSRKYFRNVTWEEVGNELVEDLIDLLNSSAPPHYRFGAHEGDGSDFGWWPEPEYEHEDKLRRNPEYVGYDPD